MEKIQLLGIILIILLPTILIMLAWTWRIQKTKISRVVKAIEKVTGSEFHPMPTFSVQWQSFEGYFYCQRVKIYLGLARSFYLATYLKSRSILDFYNYKNCPSIPFFLDENLEDSLRKIISELVEISINHEATINAGIRGIKRQSKHQ